MTNTKICPQCSEVNSIQAASCPRCGRQFKTTAPLNDWQNEPKTVVGSFSPNLSQQNQPNSNPPPNFGQQPNFNQPSGNSSYSNQQPKKSSKAVWWIAGGAGGLLIIGVIVLAVIGIGVFTVNNIYDTPLEGTKWQEKNGNTMIFGTNQRYTAFVPSVNKTVNGDMTISDHIVQIKIDNTNATMTFRWTIIGNKLSMINTSDGTSNVLTRIE